MRSTESLTVVVRQPLSTKIYQRIFMCAFKHWQWQLFIMIMASQTFHIKFPFSVFLLFAWIVRLTRVKIMIEENKTQHTHSEQQTTRDHTKVYKRSAMKRIFWIDSHNRLVRLRQKYITMTNGFMWGEYMRTETYS